MWIASTLGFFSVTLSKEDGRPQFRARVCGDLDELRAFLSEKGIAISETLTIPTADYRYRAFLDRNQLPAAFGALAETIKYSNFKGEIGASPTQRHKLGAYHEVWEVLFGCRSRGFPSGAPIGTAVLLRQRQEDAEGTNQLL